MIEHVLFSKEECQFLKTLVVDDEFSQSRVISPTTNEVVQNAYRTSSEFMLEINKDLGMFLLEKIKKLGAKTLPTELSILRYEKNQEFKIHTDSNENYPDVFKTIVIQLSEETDYVGGELCVYLNEDKTIASKKIGNVIMFNSSLKHCANKIENGVRYCLVLFMKKSNFEVVNTLI
jgi:predicted 2-oxoglutarate/Fe(II)-dependent dioxygenase YbiX